jgi:hypothetical protein
VKFNFVDNRKYDGKLVFIPMKSIACGLTKRNEEADIADLVDPILIIAKQNNLHVRVIEKFECGVKMLYFEYCEKDIVKAIHLLHISTVLN